VSGTLLNKLVLDDPDADATVAITFHLVSYDRSFDRCNMTVDGAVEKPHDKADS